MPLGRDGHSSQEQAERRYGSREDGAKREGVVFGARALPGQLAEGQGPAPPCASRHVMGEAENNEQRKCFSARRSFANAQQWYSDGFPQVAVYCAWALLPADAEGRWNLVGDEHSCLQEVPCESAVGDSVLAGWAVGDSNRAGRVRQV